MIEKSTHKKQTFFKKNSTDTGMSIYYFADELKKAD